MFLILLLLVLVPFQLVAVDSAQPTRTPLMRVVEPATAKVGAEILVTGDNLGKQCVAEVFLTADKASHKVKVLSQEDKLLKFEVPQGVRPGAYRITVPTNSSDPILIEEPVRIVIQD